MKVISSVVNYVKDKSIIQENDRFIYVTEIYLYRDNNYFSLVRKDYYASNVEIPNVVPSFWKTKNIEICSELYAAPLSWILANGYEIHIQKEKPKRVKKIKENEK